MQARISVALSLLTVAVLTAVPCQGSPIDKGGSLQIACEMTEGCGGGLVYHTPEEELPLLAPAMVEAPRPAVRMEIRPVQFSETEETFQGITYPPLSLMLKVPVQPTIYYVPQIGY